MPVIVLTHGEFPFPDDFPAEKLEAVWTSGQEPLAALVPGTLLIVATESSHYIQLDRPDLVITAIHDVVNAVRDPGAWGTSVAVRPTG